MWPRKCFQMIDFIAVIVSVKFSSKSELSSRFFGRLKFSVRFEYLSLWRQLLLKSATAPSESTPTTSVRERFAGKTSGICRPNGLMASSARSGRCHHHASRTRARALSSKAYGLAFGRWLVGVASSNTPVAVGPAN